MDLWDESNREELLKLEGPEFRGRHTAKEALFWTPTGIISHFEFVKSY